MPTKKEQGPDEFVYVGESVDRASLKNQEARRLYKDGERHEHVKQNVHRVFICLIWTVSTLAMVVIIIRILHLIMPECWYWLTTENIQQIDKFLFSGAIGGFLGRYIDKIL